MSIEDKILRNILNVSQDDYSKGENKSLSVSCSLCGEITPKGEYYKRNIVEPDSVMPYAFLCEECYKWLGDRDE